MFIPWPLGSRKLWPRLLRTTPFQKAGPASPPPLPCFLWDSWRRSSPDAAWLDSPAPLMCGCVKRAALITPDLGDVPLSPQPQSSHSPTRCRWVKPESRGYQQMACGKPGSFPKWKGGRTKAFCSGLSWAWWASVRRLQERSCRGVAGQGHEGEERCPRGGLAVCLWPCAFSWISRCFFLSFACPFLSLLSLLCRLLISSCSSSFSSSFSCGPSCACPPGRPRAGR